MIRYSKITEKNATVFSVSDFFRRKFHPKMSHSKRIPAGLLRQVAIFTISIMYFTAASGAALTKELVCEVPAGSASISTIVKAATTKVRVTLSSVDGHERVLTFQLFDITGIPEANLLNAGIEIPELGVRNYFRPNPEIIGKADYDKLLKEWNKLPGPEAWSFPLEFQQSSDGVECYFDGKYAGLVLPGGKLKSILLTLPQGASAKPFAFRGSAGYSRESYYLLNINRLNISDGKDKPVCKINSPLSVPMLSPAVQGLNLGITANQQARKGVNLTSYYTYRSAFDNLKDSFILTVPRAQYTRAWILAAVDDSPGKDPVITARLTRFATGKGYCGRARECLADTSVRLPANAEAAAGAGITSVGIAEINGKNMPLYLVEIPLDSGSIQDLIFYEQGTKQRGTVNIGPYMDFEVLGRLMPQERPHPTLGDKRMYPDSHYVSGVHVFGVTLEKTPVEMEILQTQSGNIFHNDEKPELIVALRALRDGEYQLDWVIRDVDGRKVGEIKKNLVLNVSAGEQLIPISLQQPQVGWYEIAVELKQAGRQLLAHKASFALLGPDTRQAGYESPYASWWMQGWHYSTPDPKVMGPLILKAGFRRMAIMMPEKLSEAELAPWKITSVSIAWGWLDRLLKRNASDEEIEKYIAEYLNRYPHCDNVMIFHESMPEPYRNAPELFGLPAVPEVAGAQERYEKAMKIAKIVREKFPRLKIVIGNSIASTELIAELFRRKFPEKYADYIGIETVGRSCLPERISEIGQAGVWMLKETARKFKYNWGVTSCFECNYRQDRLLGADRKASWYVRDMLLGHAYKFPYICLASMDSFGNVYNESYWGDVGLCDRYPLMYPRKSYVSVATLTKILDQVTLLREVPTKSNSIYALEFSRPDKKYIYAIWTGRGTAELDLIFPKCDNLLIVDMYGRSKNVSVSNGKIQLSASTAVQYLICDQPVGEISYRNRSYPEDQPLPGFKKVVDMEKTAEWQLLCEKDPLLEQSINTRLPCRTAGNFALREAQDEEKGFCLEVELKPASDLSTPLMSEYAILRLKKPVLLQGRPDTLGIWVKGNSGWGQVFFEIEDSKGMRWISCGDKAKDMNVFENDIEGRMSINFDGWNFLSFPITLNSPIHNLDTGGYGLWEHPVGTKGFPIYPIKLTGIGFATPQQAIYLSEMHPMKQILRFKEILAYENKDYLSMERLIKK